MSALDELEKKDESELTPLEAAVVYLYRKGHYIDDALEAAAELAALRAVAEAAREALRIYAARENWWITSDSPVDAIWQEGDTDAEPWKIADTALAKFETLEDE